MPGRCRACLLRPGCRHAAPALAQAALAQAACNNCPLHGMLARTRSGPAQRHCGCGSQRWSEFRRRTRGMAPKRAMSARAPASNDRLCSSRSASPASAPGLQPVPPAPPPACVSQPPLSHPSPRACPPSRLPPGAALRGTASTSCPGAGSASDPAPCRVLQAPTPSRLTARGITPAAYTAASPAGAADRRSSVPAALAARCGAALSSSRASVVTVACAPAGQGLARGSCACPCTE